MQPPAEALVEKTMQSLEGVDVPNALHSSIAKHQANLVNLATALLAGGQSEEAIQHTLDTVFASYRVELTKTIIALREQE